MVTEFIGRVTGLVTLAIGTGKRVGAAHHERFIILQLAHAAHLNAVLGLQSVKELEKILLARAQRCKYYMYILY